MQWFSNNERLLSNMKPLNGNVLRVQYAHRPNAGYIDCWGITETGKPFAARAQVKVIGTTHHFISIHHFCQMHFVNTN